MPPAGRSQTLTVWMLVGVLCLAAVCFNLSRMEQQMEANLVPEEPRGPRTGQGLRATMKVLVSRRVENDTEAMLNLVKQKLAQEINAAVEQEASSAIKLIDKELQDEELVVNRAPPVTAMPISKRFPGFGVEDYDEAVERRVAELEAEMILNPAVKHGLFINFGANPPKWPFNRVTDANGQDSGVVALVAPFTKYYYNREHEQALFWRLKADGHIMLGVASYEFFPGNATDPITDRNTQGKDKRMFAAVDGWLHCFRHPYDHLPPGVPRILLSQSDYIDPLHVDSSPKGLPRKYLFSHSNLGGEWNDWNRNWTLTQECVKIALAKQELPIFLVGKVVDENKTSMAQMMPFVKEGRIEISKMLGHTELTNVMEQSEFFFIPNLSDASPRVAAEALLRNVPLMMNRHIAGGWKYVNDQTGVFFDGADDFWPALERMRALRAAGKLRPREWFAERFGPKKASLRTQAFLELTVGKERMAKARSLVRASW